MLQGIDTGSARRPDRKPLINRANRSSRSGNCLTLLCQVIQLLATHRRTHQLRSLLACSENTIEIALQSTNQCTNFIMHTMHYEAAAMRCSTAQAAHPPGRRQPGPHGRYCAWIRSGSTARAAVITVHVQIILHVHMRVHWLIII